MWSEAIVKDKPHVVVYQQPRLVPQINYNYSRKGHNRSYLTNDGALQDFLLSTPKEGTWCYRKRNPQYDLTTDLSDTSQCQYIIRVLPSLAHLEMRFSLDNGFPETHELITSAPYATGDHYRRFVDIRDYIPLTNDEYKRFISAELQDYIQTIIAPGT